MNIYFILLTVFILCGTIQADSGDTYWECGPVGTHPDCDAME